MQSIAALRRTGRCAGLLTMVVVHPPPLAQAPQVVVASPVAAALDSIARSFVAAGHFSGAILVGERGRVIYQRAFGEADREWHVANTPTTSFRIASTTKQFTAALVLKLVEAGQLRLDAHIIDYLPEYPRPQGERITLRQLLTHTAAIPDYPALPRFFEDHATREHSTAALLALFDSLPLTSDPGSRWDYSNSGFVVLGAIIEHVTGLTFAVALEQLLLQPLGLTHTAYDDPTDIVLHRASGYIRSATGIINAPFIDPSTVFSAGMLRSTVGDLFRWATLLQSGRVFGDSASAREMFSSHVDTGLPLGGYGYGVFVGTQALAGHAVRVIQHGGTINGFRIGFWRMPDEDRVVIVLDNNMDVEVTALTTSLATELYRQDRHGARH